VPRDAKIAVALHDVEPSTYERVALMRDWLDDHGIDKVTLLVIPASDLHPFHDRRPDLAEWLCERVDLGDAVAQHGFQHRQTHNASMMRRLATRNRRSDGAEFVGLDVGETRRAVLAGRRVLRLAGIQPRGFVAPAYVYTGALQEALPTSFDWWAGLNRVWSDGGRRCSYSPAVRLSSPLAIRTRSLFSGPLLRLDLHPRDLDHPRQIGAVERVLRGARHRSAVTYDELAALSSSPVAVRSAG
jgi:hypothetical protein